MQGLDYASARVQRSMAWWNSVHEEKAVAAARRVGATHALLVFGGAVGHHNDDLAVHHEAALAKALATGAAASTEATLVERLSFLDFQGYDRVRHIDLSKRKNVAKLNSIQTLFVSSNHIVSIFKIK